MWNLSWQIHKWSHRIIFGGKKNEIVGENTFTKYMPSPFSQPEPFLIQQKLGHDLSWLVRRSIKSFDGWVGYVHTKQKQKLTILCYVTCRPKHSLYTDVWCRWLLLAVTGTVDGRYILNSHCYLQGSKTRHVVKYWWGDKETKLFSNCSLDPFSNRWLSWRDFGKSRSVNKLLISEHHKKMSAVN